MKIAIALVMLVLSGCATYSYQARPSFDDYNSGSFKAAADQHRSVGAGHLNRLLYLMNQGMMEHAAGEYAASIRTTQAAIERAEEFAHTSVAATAASVATNDSAMPYRGSLADQIYLHTIQMLNYAALGDWDNAMVEVRRIRTIAPNLYDAASERNYFQDPFVNYLSALIAEATGQPNDAWIDYKRALKLSPRPESLHTDVARAGARSGLAGYEAPLFSTTMATVIVVLEGGQAPVKAPIDGYVYNGELVDPALYAPNAVSLLTIPTYVDLSPGPSPVTVLLDDHAMGNLEPLDDVGRAMRGTLQDEMPAIVARSVARLAAKITASEVVAQKVNPDLGVLMGALTVASNTTDLRSFDSLPRYFAVYRSAITPGHHDLTVQIPGHDTVVLATQDFVAGKTYLFVKRVIQ